MRLPIPPRSITQEEVSDYTSSWEQLLSTGSSTDLQACFTSSDKSHINYAYLTAKELDPLLEGYQATDIIKTRFLLLPGEIPVFSLALIRTNAGGEPQTGFYLAGIAGFPAELGPEFPAGPTQPAPSAAPGGKVPIDVARIWIKNWNGPLAEKLDAHLFNSPQEGQYLRGYCFEVTDFTTPWAAKSEQDNTLWLNFDLKPKNPDAPDSPVVFSTIVELNQTPPTDQPGVIALGSRAEFYDISRPSPPF